MAGAEVGLNVQRQCQVYLDRQEALRQLRLKRDRQHREAADLWKENVAHLGRRAWDDGFLSSLAERGLEDWKDLHDQVMAQGSALATLAVKHGIDPTPLNSLLAGLSDDNAILDFPSAAAVVMKLAQTAPLTAISTVSRGHRRQEMEAKALALIIQHPDWTVKRIAEAVGCHEKSLYKYDSVKQALKLRRAMRHTAPKGSKYNRQVEAESDSEE